MSNYDYPIHAVICPDLPGVHDCPPPGPRTGPPVSPYSLIDVVIGHLDSLDKKLANIGSISGDADDPWRAACMQLEEVVLFAWSGIINQGGITAGVEVNKSKRTLDFPPTWEDQDGGKWYAHPQIKLLGQVFLVNGKTADSNGKIEPKATARAIHIWISQEEGDIQGHA